MIAGLEFATALRTDSGVWTYPRVESEHFTVLDGCLEVDGEGIVPSQRVLFTITAQSDAVITIPRFNVHEHWLRRGAEWHRFMDGSLCLELPHRWGANVHAISTLFGSKQAAAYAAAYFLHSARWLITRHRYAYEHRLTAWPLDWPQWAHGDEGVLQYQRGRAA